MPQWKVNWIENIEEDFNSTEEFLKVKNKLDYISLNPNYLTKRIKNIKNKNIRRVKFGEFRLFILLDNISEEIFCLAYLPRKKCYSEKSINKVLKIVQSISN